MGGLGISIIIFICVFGGAVLGIILRIILPDHHLSEDSKDVVKLGTGMIATLAALVLGLLIASAKGTFDTINSELKAVGSKIILLDHTMAEYGPETRDARTDLRLIVSYAVKSHWPDQKIHLKRPAKPIEPGAGLWSVQGKLRALRPESDARRATQVQALQLCREISEARWLMMEQWGQSSMPKPFLVMLTFWLTIIFAGFGLLSPRNGTVITVLLICALSVAGAILLIEEMDHPYQGLIKVSSDPLTRALTVIGE